MCHHHINSTEERIYLSTLNYRYSRLHHDNIVHIILLCTIALCDDPVAINNGMVTHNSNSVGAMATYACDSGFEVIGNAITVCTEVDIDSAEFQPAAPSCSREYNKKCDYKIPGMAMCPFYWHNVIYTAALY